MRLRSPRTWGCSRPAEPRPGRQHTVPTHVGVLRNNSRVELSTRYSPHALGGAPVSTATTVWPWSRSPRMWGCSAEPGLARSWTPTLLMHVGVLQVQGTCKYRLSGRSPLTLGMRHRGPQHPRRRPDGPHVCGGAPHQRSNRLARVERSPRSWRGLAGQASWRRHWYRVVATHVGFSCGAVVRVDGDFGMRVTHQVGIGQ